MRIGGGTLERSFGKAVTGAEGVSCDRHFLSRVFLNYFYRTSRRFAILRRVFACPLGQFSLPSHLISTNGCISLHLAPTSCAPLPSSAFPQPASRASILLSLRRDTIHRALPRPLFFVCRRGVGSPCPLQPPFHRALSSRGRVFCGRRISTHPYRH